MIRLPELFAKRMKEMLGTEEYAAFLASYDAPRHQGLRFNPLKMPDSFQVGGLPDWNLRPVPWAQPYGFYYGSGTRGDHNNSDTAGGPAAERPGKSPLHEAGLFYIQEPSAMAAAALSGAKPGEKILDLCAAPGGKSTQLAGMLQGRGLLVSNETHPQRAKILSQNIERMGVRNAIVTNEDSVKLAERFGSFFDRVIVDAPCSGEGMFRKEEQALFMWSPENVRHCAERQEEILDHAAMMVRSGGYLLYSTCTFAPEEDEGSAAAFLHRHPEFSLVSLPDVIGEAKMRAWGFDTGHPEWLEPDETMPSLSGTIRLWPHKLAGEGHFIALFQKEGRAVPEGISGVSEEYRTDFSGETEGRDGGRKKGSAGRRRKRAESGQETGSGTESVLWKDFVRDSLTADPAEALSREAGSRLLLFGEDLYLMPCAAEIRTDGLRILRPGLQIGRLKKGRFEPAHSLAMALRPSEVKQCADYRADSREAAAFLRGETVPCDPALKGWTLVTAEGVSMGWGKASGGVLKNHYPKGLRRPY